MVVTVESQGTFTLVFLLFSKYRRGDTRDTNSLHIRFFGGSGRQGIEPRPSADTLGPSRESNPASAPQSPLLAPA